MSVIIIVFIIMFIGAIGCIHYMIKGSEWGREDIHGPLSLLAMIFGIAMPFVLAISLMILNKQLSSDHPCPTLEKVENVYIIKSN